MSWDPAPGELRAVVIKRDVADVERTYQLRLFGDLPPFGWPAAGIAAATAYDSSLAP